MKSWSWLTRCIGSLGHRKLLLFYKFTAAGLTDPVGNSIAKETGTVSLKTVPLRCPQVIKDDHFVVRSHARERPKWFRDRWRLKRRLMGRTVKF